MWIYDLKVSQAGCKFPLRGKLLEVKKVGGSKNATFSFEPPCFQAHGGSPGTVVVNATFRHLTKDEVTESQVKVSIRAVRKAGLVLVLCMSLSSSAR